MLDAETNSSYALIHVESGGVRSKPQIGHNLAVTMIHST